MNPKVTYMCDWDNGNTIAYKYTDITDYAGEWHKFNQVIDFINNRIEIYIGGVLIYGQDYSYSEYAKLNQNNYMTYTIAPCTCDLKITQIIIREGLHINDNIIVYML